MNINYVGNKSINIIIKKKRQQQFIKANIFYLNKKTISRELKIILNEI